MRVVTSVDQINPLSPQARGLVGCWSLNDGAGTIARDLVSGNHGTLTNGPAWSVGQNGKALNFDGTNDYIQLPNTIAKLSGNAITICARVFVASFATQPTIFASDTSPTLGYGINLRFLTTGQIRFYNYTAAFFIDSNTAYSTNTLYDVAAVYGNNTYWLYVDGVLEKTGSGASNGLGFGYRIGTANLLAFYFAGRMSDVRIYNRALSADVVRDIYCRPQDLYQCPRQIILPRAGMPLHVASAGHWIQSVQSGGRVIQTIQSAGHVIWP